MTACEIDSLGWCTSVKEKVKIAIEVNAKKHKNNTREGK
jgi:hypothetical protein